MYESIFGFRDRPFVAAPLVDRYFPAASIEHARQTLARGIERAAGPGMLAGSAGTGKTLLCQLLAQQFRDRFQVVMLATARLRSARALLQNILFELRLPYRDREEGELRLALIDYLQRGEECPNGMLLVVDEAHTLPLPLLEEIRMITNLVRADQPRVRLVIAGGPTLEERFANPRLESLNQRIAARCYLEPMNRGETAQYVRSQMDAVGGDPGRIFSEDALQAIHIATDGIPRLINQLCDHALVLAAAGGKTMLDAAGIEEAWADLQQLPAPSLVGSTAKETATENVVEFGQLGEEQEAVSQTIPIGESMDFAPDDMVDPSRQIDNIEQQISEAGDDAPPTVAAEDTADDQFVASSAPAEQVEVGLETADNPFAESFEEEEVIVDRYAVLDAGGEEKPAFAMEADEPQPSEPQSEQPEVVVPEFGESESHEAESDQAEWNEPEFNEVAKTLVADSDLSQLAAEAAATEAAEDEDTPPSIEDASEDVDSESGMPLHTVQWTPDFASAEDIQDEPVADEHGQIDEVNRESAEVAAVAEVAGIVDEKPNVAPADQFSDDRDMIVVDNQVEEVPQPRGPQIGRARRQEYRRLFASLRQR